MRCGWFVFIKLWDLGTLWVFLRKNCSKSWWSLKVWNCMSHSWRHIFWVEIASCVLQSIWWHNLGVWRYVKCWGKRSVLKWHVLTVQQVRKSSMVIMNSQKRRLTFSKVWTFNDMCLWLSNCFWRSRRKWANIWWPLGLWHMKRWLDLSHGYRQGSRIKTWKSVRHYSLSKSLCII